VLVAVLVSVTILYVNPIPKKTEVLVPVMAIVEVFTLKVSPVVLKIDHKEQLIVEAPSVITRVPLPELVNGPDVMV